MRIFVDLSRWCGGLGDAIIRIPALRALRKRYPNDEIVVMGWLCHADVFSYCDYIDYYLPVDIVEGAWVNAYNITSEERTHIFDPNHNALNIYNEHDIKKGIRQLLLDFPDNEPLDLELSIRNCDIEIINELQKNLLEKANGKKIVAICPAVTCYSRMWPATRWQELTNILRENGYFVVSVGSKEDLDINVDFDGRGAYPVHHIPKILEIFDTIFTVDSGMIYAAAINQDVHIVKIKVGQYSSKYHTPYRHGELEYNTTIVGHDCPFYKKCYLGFFSGEKECQMEEFFNRWRMENNDLPQEEAWSFRRSASLDNYIYWNYCYKSTEKYACASISAEDVYNAFIQKKSIIATLTKAPAKIFHERSNRPKEDFMEWSKTILVESQGRILLAIKSDADTMLDKVKITKKLYPDHLIVVFCPKEHIPLYKNCIDVYHAVPIEYLTGRLKLGAKDVFLSLP
jgi:hypothetical protein